MPDDTEQAHGQARNPGRNGPPPVVCDLHGHEQYTSGLEAAPQKSHPRGIRTILAFGPESPRWISSIMRGMYPHFALALIVFAGLAMPAPAAAQAPAAAADVKPNDYGADASWLCRPGRKGDACDIDLTTTVVAANGG